MSLLHARHGRSLYAYAVTMRVKVVTGARSSQRPRTARWLLQAPLTRSALWQRMKGKATVLSAAVT
jgi:hypothetical protein